MVPTALQTEAFRRPKVWKSPPPPCRIKPRSGRRCSALATATEIEILLQEAHHPLIACLNPMFENGTRQRKIKSACPL